jgi:acyl-CoA thioesterase-1
MKLHVARLSLVAAALVFLLGFQPAHAAPGETVIVALGDSLTAGYGLPQDQSFPAQLQAALKARGQNVRIINAGVSGDTATAALQRLDWALPDDTKAVIVELGGNDALQGIPPEGTKQALAKIIEKVQAKGLPVLLAGMEAPRNMGKEYVKQFHAIYPDLAAQYDVLLYPFFLDGAALHDGLMQRDGIHPNGKGVAVIVAKMMPKVEALLAEAGATVDKASVGKALLEKNCARCHSITATGASPLAKAPPLRDVYRRFPIQELESGFAEGMGSRHRDMPQIQFSTEQVSAILNYLGSITGVPPSQRPRSDLPEQEAIPP